MDSEQSATFTPVRFTGDDVVFDMGCSEQWALWVISAYKQCRDNDEEVVEGGVLLKEEGRWKVITAARESFAAQLNGGDPKRLLEDAEYRYTLGFSEDHARELIEKWDRAIEFGAAEYRMNLRFHIETLEGLVGQLKAQVDVDG